MIPLLSARNPTHCHKLAGSKLTVILDACQVDIVIVGGGVIGIATAYNLSTLLPELRVILLESGGLGANTGR